METILDLLLDLLVLAIVCGLFGGLAWGLTLLGLSLTNALILVLGSAVWYRLNRLPGSRG